MKFKISEELNTEEKKINEYEFSLDDLGRVSHVEGDLQNKAGERDLSAQLDAGDEYRRDTDDGGHFIANRFNGPSEEINLFAQDSNFNRGGYKSWENQWARELEQGNSVHVDIDPVYSGDSLRPNTIMAEVTITDKKGVQRTEYYSGCNENMRSDEFYIDDELLQDI